MAKFESTLFANAFAEFCLIDYILKQTNKQGRDLGAYSYYEFFAGGGMARAGLGKGWACQFANDIDELKAKTYRANWGDTHFDERDIRKIRVSDLAENLTTLAWASFPCQDLSLAGGGLGIGAQRTAQEKRTRSGALWPFFALLRRLKKLGRNPPIVVLENVVGLLTLDEGIHFKAICRTLKALGYRYGAVVMDAKVFLPQSRPRVFLIAVKEETKIPSELVASQPDDVWHTPSVQKAFAAIGPALTSNWIWWQLGKPPARKKKKLSEVIDVSMPFSSLKETRRLLALMSPLHRAQLRAIAKTDGTHIGSVYLRMRREGTASVQRAEITFADALGCLRTPRGGASRPRIIVVDGRGIRTRLLSSVEAAQLMGLPKSYKLPEIYQHAFRVIGDGVAVPVVRYLARRLLEPLAKAMETSAPEKSPKRLVK